jgi:hypothetical protein
VHSSGAGATDKRTGLGMKKVEGEVGAQEQVCWLDLQLPSLTTICCRSIHYVHHV